MAKANITVNYVVAALMSIILGFGFIYLYRALLWIVESYGEWITLNVIFAIVGFSMVLLGCFLVYLKRYFTGFLLTHIGVVIVILILFVLIAWA